MKKKKFIFTAVLLIFGALAALILSFAVPAGNPSIEHYFITTNVLQRYSEETDETHIERVHNGQLCNLCIKGDKSLRSGSRYLVSKVVMNFVPSGETTPAEILVITYPGFGEPEGVTIGGEPGLIVVYPFQGMAYEYNNSYQNCFNIANFLVGGTAGGTIYITAQVGEERYSRTLERYIIKDLAVIQAKVYILGENGDAGGIRGIPPSVVGGTVEARP